MEILLGLENKLVLWDNGLENQIKYIGIDQFSHSRPNYIS